MKKITITILGLLLIFTCANSLELITPDKALQMLSEGNQRFFSGKAIHPNTGIARLKETFSSGQNPFAIVLGCSDSRVPIERVFDRGVGDIFSVRVAGNVASVDETASIDYAVEHLQCPLIVVLAHTKCGAVSAVVNKAEVKGSLEELIKKIKPAFELTQKTTSGLVGDSLVMATTKNNAFLTISNLLGHSEVIRTALQNGSLRIVAAIYDIEKGSVEWIGPHPSEKELLNSPLQSFSNESSPQKVTKKEIKDKHDNGNPIQNFLSGPNLIFMIGFIVFCALVSALVIFFIMLLRNKKDKPQKAEA